MNKQGKGKIEWTDHTWNPLTGICPVNCKTPDGHEYCYARKIYKRFKIMERPQNQGCDLFLVSRKEMTAPMRIKKPSKIFVCSTHEIFHPNVLEWFRDEIFCIIGDCPQHTFQVLTKMPENIDRPMPDNVWLGVSVTNDDKIYALYQDLLDAYARVKFISFEPLFLNLHYLPIRIDWAIIGRLTGHGHKYDPSLAKLKYMVKAYKKEKIPVFLKNNLRDIWKDKLIQEFPE